MADVVVHIGTLVLSIKKIKIFDQVWGIQLVDIDLFSSIKTICTIKSVLISWNMESVIHYSSYCSIPDPIQLDIDWANVKQLYQFYDRWTSLQPIQVVLAKLLEMIPAGPTYQLNIAPLRVYGRYALIEKTINFCARKYINQFK